MPPSTLLPLTVLSTIDGFALDYLGSLEPVLAMLCAKKRLHQSGVSVKDQEKDTAIASQATTTTHFFCRESKRANSFDDGILLETLTAHTINLQCRGKGWADALETGFQL